MAPTTRRTAAASPPPPPSNPPTITTHPPVEVAVVGGGLCGTLAAATLAREDGASVLVLDASPPSSVAPGGVWATAANAHSRLQAAACLYEWDAPPGPPRLTPQVEAAAETGGWEWSPARVARALAARASTALARVDAATVRAAIERYGVEAGVAARTRRGATVTAVKEGGPGGGFWVEWEEEVEVVKVVEAGSSKKAAAATTTTTTTTRHRVAADSVIVASGLLGRQLSPADRGLPPGLEGGGGRDGGRPVFRGVVSYGGRTGGVDCVAGDPAVVGDKVRACVCVWF
jgi:flavin-dependent dehydrogenase